mmetsp:Transcript_4915/g.7492  ORF Transcript_4915/g.7492 Transcript_4915/m.7492 type:complete len:766 (+) Transcript_4915:67-2364(+)
MSAFGVDAPVYLKVDDLVESPRIVEAVSSRALVAFTIKTYSITSQTGVTNLHIHDAITLGTKQMTRLQTGGVSNPAFALNMTYGDDAILFLKSTDGQIWSLPLDGGEASQVSHFPVEVESFKLYRNTDKMWLVCSLSVYPNHTVKETADMDASKGSGKGSSGMVFDGLMVRHWDTWDCYKKRQHVFVCPLDVSPTGTLLAKTENLFDLMFGLETDCPSRPFGGLEEYNVSADGSSAVFACRRTDTTGVQGRDMAWSTEVSIFSCQLPDDSHFSSSEGVRQEPGRLTLVSDENNLGTHSSPCWSPDGEKVAFLAMNTAQYESDMMRIVIWDRASGRLSDLTVGVDLSFSSISWDNIVNSDESGEKQYWLLCTAQFRGSNRIYRIGVTEMKSNPGAVALHWMGVIGGDESRCSPMIVQTHGAYKARYLYFLESTLSSPNMMKMATIDDLFEVIPSPSEIHSGLQSGEAALVTNSMRAIREIYCPCPEYFNGDLTLPRVEQYYFPAVNEDGSHSATDLVHMWYLPPVNLQSDEEEGTAAPGSYPLVLIIHGGPQSAILNSWHYRWNLSFFASRGYGVCAVNFHGSTGFGKAYVDSIRGDWGGQPFRDCIAGVDFILKQKPYLDRLRVGALGASYGGYMINWINGHSDMFKCLVNHDGIFDLRSLYYSTEELWFPEWEFGLPWENAAVYEKWSPSTYLKNWNTPTLVIQGGKDYRVVETEGLSTFTALQRRNIPSQMLFFPDENHWCLKPMNSIEWHKTIVAWLEKWLN